MFRIEDRQMFRIDNRHMFRIEDRHMFRIDDRHMFRIEDGHMFRIEDRLCMGNPVYCVVYNNPISGRLISIYDMFDKNFYHIPLPLPLQQ